MQQVHGFQLLWNQRFTGSVQQALEPPSQGPSGSKTWRCHLAEDPSSGSETNDRTKQRNQQRFRCQGRFKHKQVAVYSFRGFTFKYVSARMINLFVCLSNNPHLLPQVFHVQRQLKTDLAVVCRSTICSRRRSCARTLSRLLKSLQTLLHLSHWAQYLGDGLIVPGRKPWKLSLVRERSPSG